MHSIYFFACDFNFIDSEQTNSDYSDGEEASNERKLDINNNSLNKSKASSPSNQNQKVSTSSSSSNVKNLLNTSSSNSSEKVLKNKFLIFH
jgi:hypothetical protein